MKRLKRIIREFFTCHECGSWFFGNVETCETCRQAEADAQTYSF